MGASVRETLTPAFNKIYNTVPHSHFMHAFNHKINSKDSRLEKVVEKVIRFMSFQKIIIIII